MTGSTIAIEGVTKRYSGHLAVQSLSLRVPCGVIYGLLGPNGAGKTTTIRMINDIVRPDEGRIVLFDCLAPGRTALRRIGYLPEERGLYPKMTVRRTLTFLGELRGLTRAEIAPRIARWLDRLELSAWADAKVEALSKGMQQKVQFIAAVLNDPELLILDEPFSGLDPINADLLRTIVLEQKASGKTILFSTHLMEHAEQMCDDICIIARSQKVLEGELRSIKQRAQEERNQVLIELGGRPSGSDIPPPLQPGPATGVADCQRVERAFTLTLSPGTAASTVLRRLLDTGEEVVRFERAAPTLHQIFVDNVRETRGDGAAGRA